jgi:hypothetical protein
MADPQIRDEFPHEFFPPILEEFKESAARSLGVNGELMAGPMLAAASVGIGTATRVLLKPDWEEPASLFVAVVGYKGSSKSPAFRESLKPLEEQQRERERCAANAEQMENANPEQDASDRGCGGRGMVHVFTASEPDDEVADEEDDEDDDYELEVGDEDQGDGGPPLAGIGGANTTTSSPSAVGQAFQPPPQPLQHLVLHDTTHAALWEVLQTSPRGVIVSVDELSTVFFQSTPAQRQVWADVYHAGPRTVHRKTNRRGPVILPRTFVTLAGGIQPDLLPSIGGKYDGGLIERFMIFGTPETSLPPWSNETIDPTTEMAWDLAIKALLNIERAEYSGSADRKDYVPFTRAAYDRLGVLYESLASYLQTRGVHVKHHGVVRKLVANAARLALIRRCLRWAVGEFGFFGPVGAIDETDCDAACRVAELCMNRYLMWMPHITPPPAEARPACTPPLLPLVDRLLAYIASKNKTEVEVRWLRQQTLEGNPSTAAIRVALDGAVARGRGRWADYRKRTFVPT